MNLEQQVVGLELAKRLKELGVKQESLFWWAEYRHGHVQPEWAWQVTDSLYEGDYDHYRNAVPAYTVAELGEMLPSTIEEYSLTINKTGSDWSIRYVEEGVGHLWVNSKILFIQSSTEVDARAKMLIYLLENKLITL